VVGLLLVVDLWAGFAGAILALLALGMRVIALAAESNEDARAVAEANLPGLIHVEWVEEVRAEDFSRVLERRSFLAIVVGGGSPCQGNSSLNRKRKNLQDPRSQQPLWLRELYDSICDLKMVKEKEITVLCWLENVASAPAATKAQYDEWLGASHILIRARHFGWIDRNRCFWGRSQHRTLAEADWSNVPESVISWRDGTEPELRYSGAKPVPSSLSAEDGFVLGIDPKHVMAGRQEPLFPFTREFWHPRDPGIEDQASPAAIDRWESDHRRFPVAAYEANSLLWRESEWRVPSPRERAAVHGFPTRVVDAVPGNGRQRNQITAVQNSLLGNGFHLPSVMMFFCALLTLVEQGTASRLRTDYRWMYSPEEGALRERIAGTVFQPGLFLKFPGMFSKHELMKDIRRQVSAAEVPESVWAKATEALCENHVKSLQLYWVDTQLRGRVCSPQGPEWRAQTAGGGLPASLGSQRFPGNSKRGLDHLLRPGLGKDEHVRQAEGLPSPFRPGQVVDDDTDFATRALALMGPHLQQWRKAQRKAFDHVCGALQPVSLAIMECLTPEVKAVAEHKRPAIIAALTTLLRWPDRNQAEEYTTGFRAFGHIPSANVFRPLTKSSEEALDLDSSFWGQPARSALMELLHSRPPKEAERIFEETEQEKGKGWLGPYMDAKELDKKYGPGRWRFVPRFLLKQKDRDRIIDDALRGGQNVHTRPEETIFTLSVDWLGEVLSSQSRHIVREHKGLGEETTVEDALAALPEWFEPALGVDDLPDAYRGCPIHPDHQRGCIVAFWHPGLRAWRFAESRAMLFGLVSAVVAFNRLPTLLTASARRLMAVCAGAFFDDICTVGCCSNGGTEQAAMKAILAAVGAPVKPGKSCLMAQHRVWLGVACNLAQVTSSGLFHIRPKDSAVMQVLAGISQAQRLRSLEKGPAGKLRGQVGWTGSLTAGKCGRIGLEVLKRKQYRGPPELDEYDQEALSFLAEVVQSQPERSALVVGARPPPVLLYTDASHEPESGDPPRMGWVLFEKGIVPAGSTADVPREVTASWNTRATQIFPAEAFAVYTAVWDLRHRLEGQDVLAFVDNEGAAAALIRGSSGVEDVGCIAQALHWLLLGLRCRLWIEWIDSESNPSDGLSRDGLLDEWSRAQGWHLSVGSIPPWDLGLNQQRCVQRQTLELG